MSDPRFINTYFRYLRTKSEEDFWACYELDDAVILDPDKAWPLIKVLVEAAPDDAGIIYVGCGPLENLLFQHGERFIDRIVAEAERSERFKEALACVWGIDSLPLPVQERLHELFSPRH